MKNKQTKQIDVQILELIAQQNKTSSKIIELKTARRKIAPDESKTFRLKFQMSWVSDLDAETIWKDSDGPLRPTSQDVEAYILRMADEEGGLYPLISDWDLHPDICLDKNIKFNVVELVTSEVQ